MINFISIFYKKNKNKIKLILLISLIIFFTYFLKANEIIQIIQNLKINFFLFSLFISLLFPILITLRWYYLINVYLNKSFFTFLKNIIEGSVLSSLTMTSLAIDVYKFVYISNYLDKHKSFLLVLADKVLSLYFKLICVLTLFIIYNYFIFNFPINNYLFFSLLIFIILLFKIFNYIINLKFIEKILPNSFINNLKKINTIILNNYFKLLFVNFLIQFITILVYAAIAMSIDLNDSIYIVSLIAPILETITQLQIVSFGFREFVSINILSNFSISKEEAFIIALLFTGITTFVTIFFNGLVIFYSRYIKNIDDRII